LPTLWFWPMRVRILRFGGRDLAITLAELAILMPAPVWAQGSAVVVGAVTDTSGGVIPGALVSVENLRSPL
jgi:hypothetical protein